MKRSAPSSKDTATRTPTPGLRVVIRDDQPEPSELAFDVEGRPLAEGLRLEADGLGRARLRIGSRGLMWARVWSDFFGVSLVRNVEEASPGILPPFRASEARAHTERSWWLRRIALALGASPWSPLRQGPWQLTALRPDPARSSIFDSPAHQLGDELGITAVNLLQALDSPVWREDDYGGHGSWEVWPLRKPSPPDAPRVKAWRKHARAGTLPPLVLWSVSGLLTHLLIDGHDRLAAARAEGVTPEVFVLWHVAEWPPDGAQMQHASSTYEKLFDQPHMNEVGRSALHRSLQRAFRPRREPTWTTSTARPDLADEWDEEVRALLGEEADQLTRRDH